MFLAALGRVYLYGGQYEKAISLYNEAIGIYEYSLYYNQLAVAYMNMECDKCLGIALSHLKKAQELNAKEGFNFYINEAAILKNEGIVYSKQGKFFESNQKFESIKEYHDYYAEEIEFYSALNFFGMGPKSKAMGCEHLRLYKESENKGLIFNRNRREMAEKLFLENGC